MQRPPEMTTGGHAIQLVSLSLRASGHQLQTALMAGFTVSIRARQASTISREDSSRERNARAWAPADQYIASFIDDNYLPSETDFLVLMIES